MRKLEKSVFFLSFAEFRDAYDDINQNDILNSRNKRDLELDEKI